MKRFIAVLLMICVFGVNVNAFSGEMIPTATSRPTEVCPDEFYEHDFSGTKNYTYSRYLANVNDSVIISSDSKFEVKTYYSNGEFANSFTPEKQSDGSYRIEFGAMSISRLYYFVVYNRSGSAMKNARYTISRNGAWYSRPALEK